MAAEAVAPVARRPGKLEPDARGFRADNPAQRFSTLIARDGALITAATQSWSLQLAVQRVGRAGAMLQAGADTPREREGRVEIARGRGVLEWFVHDDRGLEQGVDIAERPSGDGDLLVEVGAEGLTPVQVGSRIELRTHDGGSVLTYGGLDVRDAKGAHVDASMNVERGRIVIHVRDASATYPIAIDPLVWGLRQAQLLPSTSYDAQFGQSVAVQGPLLLVGAPAEGDSATVQGVVYAFQRGGSTWTRQARLTASDYAAYDLFGSGIALKGSIAVIGARQKTIGANSSQGAAYVFSQSGTTWSQDARLVAADGAANDGFGSSVAFDGTTAVIGARSKTVGTKTYQGMVYVYGLVGTAWTKLDEFTSSDGVSGDLFGASVAVSGDTIVVGASLATVGTNARQGAAYVFTKVGSSWVQQAKLTASDAIADQRFGAGVAIGTPGILVTTNEAKSAYAFTGSGGTWTATKLVPSYVDSFGTNTFGPSVAIYGTTALLGSFLFDSAGGSWLEQARLPDPEAYDGFGQGGVSLDGTSLVVGAPSRKSSSTSSFTPGAAWVLVKGSALGDACTTASSCVSGFCVDGVCCESACTGTCQSCSAAKSTAGVDGLCRPTKGGTDPDGDCPAKCVGSQLYPASACAGTSSFCTSVPATSCAPYKCAAVGAACRTACVDNTDCDSTAYCGSSGCITKLAVGKACTAGIQCTSGNCVDGVCCSTSCTASCYACSKALTGGSDGTCAAIPDGSDPDGNCAAPSCSGTALTRGVCNGAGGCRTSTKDCAPASCVVVGGGATCATPCTTDASCGGTDYCLSGVCTPKLGKGSACTASSQCTSGFCTDGVCCDVACGGQCEACAEAATKGTCTPVVDAPRGGRPTCGTDPTCAGKCDGVVRTSCARPAAGTACGAGCAAGNRASCDGAGVCLAPSPCPNHLACENATECKSSCVANADCAATYQCVSGVCVTAMGAHCSADGGSSIGTDFSVTPCLPYRCDPTTGACRTTCSGSADCATGATCSSANRCVVETGADASADDAIASDASPDSMTPTDDSAPRDPPSDAATSESGSCAHGRRGSSGAWLVVLAFTVLARRRRS